MKPTGEDGLAHLVVEIGDRIHDAAERSSDDQLDRRFEIGLATLRGAPRR